MKHLKGFKVFENNVLSVKAQLDSILSMFKDEFGFSSCTSDFKNTFTYYSEDRVEITESLISELKKVYKKVELEIPSDTFIMLFDGKVVNAVLFDDVKYYRNAFSRLALLPDVIESGQLHKLIGRKLDICLLVPFDAPFHAQ